MSRQFSANVDEQSEEIQTYDPPIAGLTLVSNHPSLPNCTRIHPLDEPPLRIQEPMPGGGEIVKRDEDFDEATVWLGFDETGMLHGSVMAITSRGCVFAQDFVP